MGILEEEPRRGFSQPLERRLVDHVRGRAGVRQRNGQRSARMRSAARDALDRCFRQSDRCALRRLISVDSANAFAALERFGIAGQ